MLAARKPSRPEGRFGIRVLTSGLSLVLLILGAGTARAIDIDIGDGSGSVGDTVTVPVTTTDLTGAGIFSYEIDISWSSTRATLIDAPVAGTITAPWGSVTLNSTPGAVTIVAAGVVALADSGTLLELEFVLGPSSGSTILTLNSVVLNEGSPTANRTNGSLTVIALPVVGISPDVGEIAVGDSLRFFASGGTSPYTFGSTDPSVGSFGGTDYLKGIGPGRVRCFALDSGGLSDTTTGFIDVVPFKLTAVGSGPYAPGDTFTVPMMLTDPSPYGITSAEFAVVYIESYVTAIGADIAGTIAGAAGWAAPVANVTSGRIQVSMAGASPLAGAGVLVNLVFVVDAAPSTSVWMSPQNGLLNETFQAIEVSGLVTLTPFPSLTVSPNTATIVVGDDLSFFLFGGPTPPVTWGVTNGAVASISAAGLLTGLAAGTTRVSGTDAIGASDTSDVIRVCDLYVVAPDTVVSTFSPTGVPIRADRDVTGMGIYGFEMTVTFDPSKVRFDGVTTTGTLIASWGSPVVNEATPGQVILVHAGSTPLAGTGPLLILRFQGLVPALGSTSNLTITRILFNEGDPCALVVNGTMNIPTAALGDLPPAVTLEQNIPNPFNPTTLIRYGVEGPGQVRLSIYAPSGRLVRVLVDRYHEGGGRYAVRWDGTDDRGRGVASGVYLYRIEAGGTRLERKMVILK